MTAIRRRYRMPAYRGATCQDCGRLGFRVTVIAFWASGMRYRVCRECIRAYRGVILAPSATTNAETTARV